MKRKGFTLIELLAVIVILAIIALIATPIILGIVEDARKDSFLRSVELVIKTTDIDIFNKEYNDTYTYAINDGNISNLEVGVKNTDGMNGSITYDKNGNDTYAIHNGKYCVMKEEGMKNAEIRDYVEGECELSSKNNGVSLMTTLTSLVPYEDDSLLSTNGQLINLGRYGIRYQGYDPDNYIYFNCEDYRDQSEETCELWRIIGIVDGKVKIVKDENIGNYKWDYKCDQNGENCISENNWNEATLKVYLNGTNEGDYYYGLTPSTKLLISPSTWYLRGWDTANVLKSEMYDIERTTGVVIHEIEKIDNTNIGLMYPSDYGFAAMETENCTSDDDLFTQYLGCKETNWLAQGSAGTYFQFLITPVTVFGSYYVNPSGYLLYNGGVPSEMGVRPTLYLETDTLINDGFGTLQEPFNLVSIDIIR